MQILIVQQREESNLQGAIGCWHACAGGREPGIFDVGHSDAGANIRRGRAVDDHLGSAVIDVMVRRNDLEPRRLEAHLNVFRRAARELAQVEP